MSAMNLCQKVQFTSARIPTGWVLPTEAELRGKLLKNGAG